MRYRKLTSAGDYQFGHGGSDFLVDSPACVGQSVQTRLLLMAGEWFLDTREGTAYGSILGENTRAFYDLAVQQRVLETDGVTKIDEYASDLDGATRRLAVEMTISTRFGAVQVAVVF